MKYMKRNDNISAFNSTKYDSAEIIWLSYMQSGLLGIK